MLVTTEGIVLRQRKIANNRRMIVIFTKDYGKISAGTSINEKSKGKSALALRPFTHAEYDLFKSRDSYSINSAQVKHSYYTIGEDLDRFLIASKLIEYLDAILVEGQARAKLYEMTLSFFESITRKESDFETLLYAFIVQSLRVQGVMPELSGCVNCGKKDAKLFSVSAGGMICEDCARREKEAGNYLIYKPNFDIVEVLTYYMNNPLERFEKITLKPKISEELRQILSSYIKYHMGVDVLDNKIELT